jgi:ABC-2 type transport system ATP-binding protein
MSDSHSMQTQPVRNTAPEPGPNTIAWANHLSKTFGEQSAVTDLTFEVPRGAIVGLIGPSGSGKTTTIRLLTGIYQPTTGEARVLGRTPSDFSTRDREKIGYLTQSFVLYPDLTVRENMDFAASLYGVQFRRGRRINNLLDFVELGEHKHKLARNLSGGMQRRLSLAATLIHRPELLFLDEPTAGIDPMLRRKIWDYFKELQSDGYTMMVTTQYVGEAAYCDFVGIMAAGRLLLVDTPEGMRRRAFGGDVVNLRTVQNIPISERGRLEQFDFVVAPVVQVNAREVRLVVKEADTALPPIMDWARDSNLGIESIGEYQPPFDDVFVKLVRQEGAEIEDA